VKQQSAREEAGPVPSRRSANRKDLAVAVAPTSHHSSQFRRGDFEPLVAGLASARVGVGD
jgi:hypothetical protein